jgi:hypothetical protein
MSIIRALLIHRFTIKQTVQKITAGVVSHDLDICQIDVLGRFEALSGSRQRDFVGAAKQVSKVLFTDFNDNIKVGRIIEDQRNCQEYDVVRVDEMSTLSDHHLEVFLEERRTDIG